MPCYDPRSADEPKIIYRDNPNKDLELEQLSTIVDKLEASLCAILSEVSKLDNSNDIIAQASRSGLVDIMSFWVQHQKSDETRLAKELHKFSEHEQEVLKRLLNQ